MNGAKTHIAYTLKTNLNLWQEWGKCNDRSRISRTVLYAISTQINEKNGISYNLRMSLNGWTSLKIFLKTPKNYTPEIPHGT